jgi:hypothetical protein
LMETLKAAEGRTDVDEGVLDELEGQPAPGDVNVEAPPDHVFGIPDPEDPDPYGVYALEKEGLEIRDAATRSRAPSQQFEYNPSPTSPTYNRFHRGSVGAGSGTPRSAGERIRDSWGSGPYGRERSHTLMSDAGTQTDPASTTSSRSSAYTLSHHSEISSTERDKKVGVDAEACVFDDIDIHEGASKRKSG